MSRHLPWTILLLLLLATLGHADSETKKDSPGLREAEVRFADGSTVRVLLLQESLEVVTKYGKLMIPTNEMRRIEFGLHLPDDIARKVEEAIGRLGSDTFNQREVAGKDLIALGAQAYPALKNASKSSDLEIAQRARAAMERIKEKVPSSQLRLRVDDYVLSNEFPISGRIANLTIKARTAYFGDLDLKVTELRAIRWTAGAVEGSEVTLDATKYGLQDASQWMDTGVTVDPENALAITASGSVSLRQGGGGRFDIGPAGSKEFQRNGNGIHPPGALLGRIGESGAPFIIGEKYEGTPTQEGKLYLQIAPSPWENCTGLFKVKITGGRKEGM